jgi:hypothetical protein
MHPYAEDPPEDDDTDYEPMEEEPELAKEDAIGHAMAISKAEKRAQWTGLELAIQASQQEPPPPLSPAPKNLPLPLDHFAPGLGACDLFYCSRGGRRQRWSVTEMVTAGLNSRKNYAVVLGRSPRRSACM